VPQEPETDINGLKCRWFTVPIIWQIPLISTVFSSKKHILLA
jgi:hypothetical protein